MRLRITKKITISASRIITISDNPILILLNIYNIVFILLFGLGKVIYPLVYVCWIAMDFNVLNITGIRPLYLIFNQTIRLFIPFYGIDF